MVNPSEVQRQKVVVVVDPYSSGKYLLQELQQQQWPMVGIQSSQDLADFWLAQFDASLFVKSIQHNTFEDTLAALSEFDIAAVLPGSEPGVLLAEDLQDHFKLPCNGADTKDWRRDKHAMQERLREVGTVRAIKQLYSNDVDEILRWQTQWGKWPVIVKPAMSGGTDGVYWCHSEEDVRQAHAAECGKMNVNGVVNDKLLVQEYLDGLEYIVDCVSSEGRHIVSGIWVYKKTKNAVTKSISYEYARLLESTGKEQDALIAYTFEVLNALNIKHGPSHTEVIITDDGPCLVETGARMHGLKGPKMTEYGTGIGTHELVVDVAVNNSRIFRDLFEKGTRYTVKKYAFETMLKNEKVEGILSQPIDEEQIKSMPSVMDAFISVKKGEELRITRDLATSPGVILQLHASLDVCFRDIELLRKMEATSLYQVLRPISLSGSPKMSPSMSPSVMSPSHAEATGRMSSKGGYPGDTEICMTGFSLDPSNDLE